MRIETAAVAQTEGVLVPYARRAKAGNSRLVTFFLPSLMVNGLGLNDIDRIVTNMRLCIYGGELTANQNRTRKFFLQRLHEGREATEGQFKPKRELV